MLTICNAVINNIVVCYTTLHYFSAIFIPFRHLPAVSDAQKYLSIAISCTIYFSNIMKFIIFDVCCLKCVNCKIVTMEKNVDSSYKVIVAGSDVAGILACTDGTAPFVSLTHSNPSKSLAQFHQLSLVVAVRCEVFFTQHRVSRHRGRGSEVASL